MTDKVEVVYITGDQFRAIMNDMKRHDKRIERMIKEQGRKIDELLIEVKQTAKQISDLYDKGELVKLGGAK